MRWGTRATGGRLTPAARDRHGSMETQTSERRRVCVSIDSMTTHCSRQVARLVFGPSCLRAVFKECCYAYCTDRIRGRLDACTADLVGLLYLRAKSSPAPTASSKAGRSCRTGSAMGAVGKVAIDPDGRHIWAVVRCERLEDPARFGDECRDSKTDPILQFSPEGKVVKSFGGGMFIWPHGLDVDQDGNVWVTDAVATNRIPKGDKRGHVGRASSARRGKCC